MKGSEADTPGVTVLIVDDQQVVRDGLALILALLDGIDVVGTAVDGADAVRQTAQRRPDVVLMDLKMPTMDGIEATRRICATSPASAVVVLTTYVDDHSVFEALTAGARGFLTKDAGADEIQNAIHTVAAGQAQLDPTIQRRLLESFTAGARAGVTVMTDDGTNHLPLTGREGEVLREIAHGFANREIAQRLYISEATVKTHVNHLLAKTGCHDRAALVSYAFRTGRTRA